VLLEHFILEAGLEAQLRGVLIVKVQVGLRQVQKVSDSTRKPDIGEHEQTWNKLAPSDGERNLLLYSVRVRRLPPACRQR
jgi:hypothetical protein